MGFSLSWVAAPGKNPQELLRRLGLRSTHTFEEIPESALVCTVFETDWTVVLTQGEEPPVTETFCARLSKAWELVTCVVEEHVMFSQASNWRKGERVWSVVHDAQVSRDHLEVTGQAPESLDRIWRAVDEMKRSTPIDGVDYAFDVPVLLAESVTGFRHDASEPERRFEVLERTPWWGRLFTPRER